MSRTQSQPGSRAGSAATNREDKTPGDRRLIVVRGLRQRPLIWSLLLGTTLLVAAAATFATDDTSSKGGKDDKESAEKGPLPSVVVAAVQMQDVAAEHRYIGTIKAIQSVDVRARVEGFLDEMAFQQGHTVEAGQLLYQIEQDQYQAALASAEGQLAAAQASLASAKATLEDKQADFERFAVLVKKGDTSQTNFDRARAQRDEAQANVESANASIKQAQAAIEQANINLGYTTISSPIAGRIGATKYTKGNLVNPSSGTLATVVQLDPIRAVFSIPGADFVRIQERVADDGADHARDLFVPGLILPTGKAYDHKGKVAFADNQVNPSTGTIPIYADFPNPDRLLLPGQFVTAVVRTAETKQEPVVPASAILRTRDGEQVFLVGKDNRVEQRTIKTGIQVGTGYAVTSGLQSGEIVIVSGVQKVKPGMEVKPVKESAADAKSGGDTSSSGTESGASATSNGASDSK
ncbi:efflux RND transporter periplasmic adaptor subunit [Lamprobacter modestohalophilus]|uniref:efflux RND transporter periplasmic adaptor subunit n=1 Tax=Lamprobacter modestohalophilus TaxID=1064514 RepID=UPI002ADED399|nr:efflux RND transporter periplasmic adaptor subunit [Lamprobacter modestohalophilus]MEA1052733.1 efflux RND transporter periplasmic adaptor subunit [Lamprobacter modestohalophilus]